MDVVDGSNSSRDRNHPCERTSAVQRGRCHRLVTRRVRAAERRGVELDNGGRSRSHGRGAHTKRYRFAGRGGDVEPVKGVIHCQQIGDERHNVGRLHNDTEDHLCDGVGSGGSRRSKLKLHCVETRCSGTRCPGNRPSGAKQCKSRRKHGGKTAVDRWCRYDRVRLPIILIREHVRVCLLSIHCHDRHKSDAWRRRDRSREIDAR